MSEGKNGREGIGEDTAKGQGNGKVKRIVLVFCSHRNYVCNRCVTMGWICFCVCTFVLVSKCVYIFFFLCVCVPMYTCTRTYKLSVRICLFMNRSLKSIYVCVCV